jgi:hypothetical protein
VSRFDRLPRDHPDRLDMGGTGKTPDEKDTPVTHPDERVERLELQLTPEAIAYYKQIHAIVNDPRLKTQDLLVNLDGEITAINNAGAATADLTSALDELWAHLMAHDYTLPLDDGRLEELRRDYT